MYGIWNERWILNDFYVISGTCATHWRQGTHKKQTKNKKNGTTEEKYENKVIGVVVAIIIVSLETIYITFFFYFLTSLSHLLLLIKASEHLQGRHRPKKR